MYTWINLSAFHRVICLACHYTHVSLSSWDSSMPPNERATLTCAHRTLLRQRNVLHMDGARQTCKSHFSLKLKFPRAKLNRVKQRAAAHTGVKSNPTICSLFRFYIPVSFFAPIQNECRKRASSNSEYRGKIHAFSLGLTITNKMSALCLVWWTNEWTNESQSTCVISKISRLKQIAHTETETEIESESNNNQNKMECEGSEISTSIATRTW